MESLKNDMDKLVVNDISASMQYFGIVDYAVFGALLIVSLLIGLYFGFSRNQTNNEYLVGDRKMKLFPVSMSLVASYVSGIFLLGITTEIYIYGIQFLYYIITFILMAIAMIKIFLPIYHGLNIVSSYEYLELRFDKRVRLFGSGLFTFLMLAWLPLVIYVPALAFNQVSGVNVHIITPVVCVICIIYTCVGGIKAVVWTDVIQIVFMFGSILVVIIVGTIDVGGISVIMRRNLESGRIEGPNWDFNPMTRHTIWGIVFGGFFNCLSGSATNQFMIQRYVSLPDLKTAKRAVCLFVCGILFVFFTCSYCGLLIYAKYHDCDPITTKLAEAKDQLLPLFVMDMFKDYPGFPGLFTAGVFSAALSSLSTGLNSMSAVALEDFYKPYSKKNLSERSSKVFLKCVVVMTGLISIGLIFVVEKLGTILQLSGSFNAIGSGATVGIFLAGILFPRIHSTGALFGGIAGFITTAFVCLSSQYAIARGDLVFKQMPVSTEGCSYSFLSNSTIIADFSQTTDDFKFYKISYLWYTMIGTLTTLIVSFIISVIWKPIKSTDIDLKLLAPFLRKYYSKNESDMTSDKPASFVEIKLN